MQRSGFKPPTKEKLAILAEKKRERAKQRKATQKPRKSAPRASQKAKRPSLRLLKDKLWAECKRVVRKLYGNGDGTFTCYTCGAHLDTPSKAQTGHFIPSSVCSTEMRYSLDNLRVQCYRCNINLSGNWIEYERKLNEEKGHGFTDALKKQNENTKGLMYREDWYIAKIEEYKML